MADETMKGQLESRHFPSVTKTHIFYYCAAQVSTLQVVAIAFEADQKR